MQTIRVIVVDEQPLFRAGIQATLEQMGDCTIVGTSTDTAEILEIARIGKPDVLLIDAGLTTADSLDLARQVRHIIPQIAMIILTPIEDEEYLFQSIKVGAAAYYTRDLKQEELEEAIRRVSKGEYLINDAVLDRPHLDNRVPRSLHQQIFAEETPPIRNDASPLSSREIEILDFIAHGNSNKEIAKSLKISDQTVKNHITSILRKLAVNDRTSAVVYALRQHWISLDEH